jgi:hypothetical protein
MNRKGNSFGDLELGWELNFGVTGSSKALKWAETAFREDQEIIEGIPSASGKKYVRYHFLRLISSEK